MTIIRPSLADSSALHQSHKIYYGTTPKAGYYEELIYVSHNPIFVAVGDDTNILGYIATRVKPQSSSVYIVAFCLFNKSVDTGRELIAKVIESSKELKAKRIEMHIRTNRRNVIKLFESLGFHAKLAGTYKSGDDKKLLYLELEGGKEKLNLPAYKSIKDKGGATATKYGGYTHGTTYKPPAKPKPKKGYYVIRRAKKGDMATVVSLHNEYMTKKRTIEYFSKILKVRPSFFWVAVDSNDDVIGFLAARPERIAEVTVGKYTRLNFTSMVINKKWRKLGIAKALINKMFIAVKYDKSIEYIYGHVRGDNKAARKLYRDIGFKERSIGIYGDDDDEKFEVSKRYKLPSIAPYWTKYKEYIIWFAMGVIGHETFTLITDSED